VERGSTDPEDHWPAATVTRRVDDGDVVTFGEWRFVAHATPGHTPGAITWSVVLRDHGHPVPALFLSSTSVPGGTMLVDNSGYPTIASDYAATFMKLARMSCETFFHEHPQGFGFDRKAEALKQNPAANPFLDPAGCRASVAEDYRDFMALLERQKPPGQV
jgi:metallo-beta-lactamase class B